MSSTENDAAADVQGQLRTFRQAVPLQIQCREVLRLAGRTDGLDCMDYASANPVLSYHLRRHGGSWQTAVDGAGDDVAQFKALLEDGVVPVSGMPPDLPFEPKSFDLVTVLGGMERAVDDLGFIQAFHRVLRPDGRLIICVRRTKSASLLGPLSSLTGLSLERKGWARPGYTEPELFNVLKNGFDVHQMRSHGKFFLALADSVAERRAAQSGGQQSSRSLGALGLLYRTAIQLDLLLCFSKGFWMVALAKRRGWRSRQAPILIDGRSISEAVLSRPAV